MNRSQICVILAAVGLSFILVFATLLKRTGMSSSEQLFFRLVFSLVILLPVAAYGWRLQFATRNNVLFFAAIGSTYAFFALSGLSAIAFDTPIAVSVALIYTQPIFTTVISFATKQEKPPVVMVAVVFLGVLGAFLVSGLAAANPQINPGIVFSVLAGFFYSVYLWLKRRAPKSEYTPLQVLFNTYLFATPILLVAWLLSWNLNADPLLVSVITPDAVQMLLLFSFALFSTVLPYGLLNYVKAEEISPTTEGMLLLGDPLLHALWAMLFFQQYISTVQYVGAFLILASAALNLRIAAKRSKGIHFERGHSQRSFRHLGHLLSYFESVAFSRSTSTTLAREASQASTSANSFSRAFLSFSFSASPSSAISSFSHSYVLVLPRRES